MTERTRRIIPRRLSFNLEDFPETEGERINLNSATEVERFNGEREGISTVTPTVTGNGRHEELNLLSSLEKITLTQSDMHTTILVDVLNSILTGQQSLANLVADLKSQTASSLAPGREGAISCFPIFDLKPPLVEEILAKPYPMGYRSPSFRKFDGAGSVREHLMCFLDDLGVHRNNKELRLKEFSKSLSGRAFTWYDKLYPHSIRIWEELAAEFCGKFLEEEGALHIMDLGRVKQRAGESLVAFIKRYRDRALQCKETLPEADLGTDVAEAMKRQGNRPKDAEGAYDVCALEERGRKKNFRNNPPSRRFTPEAGEDLLHLPINSQQACQLAEEWLKDGTIQPRVSRPPLTKEQYDDPAYCVVHRTTAHTTLGCFTMRQAFQRQKRGRIRIEEIGEEGNTEEETLALGLAKTRSFRILFGQLGLDHDAQYEAAKALMRIVKDNGGELSAANAPHTRLAQSHATAIIFREPTLQGTGFCHNKSLYLEASIEGLKVRRALVDNGSGVNILPVYLFKMLNIPRHRLRASDITLSTFHGVRAPFEASESHLIDTALFDEPAPPRSSRLKKERTIALQGHKESDVRGSFVRPTEALKRPRNRAESGAPTKCPIIPEEVMVARQTTDEGDEIKSAPNELQDIPKYPESELEEVDIGEKEDEKRPVFICKSLEAEEKESLIKLLKEFMGVFAGDYSDMPGLRTHLVFHNLAVSPSAIPEGVSEDQSKIEAITRMKPPTNIKEAQQLIGKLGYIRRFIPAMGEFVGPLRSLLKGKGTFIWRAEHQQVFNQIKETMASMHVMSPPVPEKPLRLYIVVNEQAISGLIAQELEGRERPICYLSRVLKDVESRYPKQERYCLALAYAAQKYRHYFQTHAIEVMCKSEGIRCLIQNPSLTGRMSRWALMMSEHDVRLVHPTKLRSQALTDMLAVCSPGRIDDFTEELGGEMPEVHSCEEHEAQWWTLQFDGTPANPCGGAGVVLEQERGKVFAFSYHLGFPCTNNEAEYEALILGLRMAEELGAKKLRIKGDSNLVIKQLKGQFGAKEESLAVYPKEALRILKTFKEVEASHIPRVENKHVEALATIAAREKRDGGEQVVIFKKRKAPSLALKPLQEGSKDWRGPLLEKLRQRNSSKVAREYRELRGTLYKKSAEGLLMRCVAEEEVMMRADNLHYAICGEGGPNLYRRMQQVGMFWTSMKAHCEAVQSSCEQCKDAKEWMEINMVYEDWRKPIKEYLEAGVLPADPRDADKLKRRSQKYFCSNGEIFKRSFTGETLRCVEPRQQEAITTEVHKGVCGRHQGGRNLWVEILRLGYYWPKMKEDTLEFVRKCVQCQKQGDLIHAPSASMLGVMSPYPFHTWVMDFVGPITPASGGKRWILAATEHYTRWVEAIATKEAKAEVVTSFIKENIICRFGLPQRIVSDNGTHFVNSKAESTNKNLLRILARMIGDAPRDWVSYLPLALWAYRTTKHGEGVPREASAEGVEEDRAKAEDELMKHRRRLTLEYEKLVRPRMFHEGELVLKASDAVMRKQHVSKWALNWEGPYIVKEAHDSGYCTLLDPEEERIIGPINFKYVKKYYA
ncbi:Ribonuclease H domain [Sesbania bispinosa]|nr:Ribonuclease H domain [Sesbania bispinosa]